MRRTIFLLSLMIIMIFGLIACSNDEESESNEIDTYTVGVDNTYPPFEYQEDGELIGIDVDLIKAIAKDQGFEVQIEQMDFSGIIPSMQAKELDIGMGGMTIREERKDTVDFSDPYFESGISLVVHEDNSDINGLEDLKGKSVAVKGGTVGSDFAIENEEEYGYEIIQVSDSTSMFQEVSNGSSDALMEDFPAISYSIRVSDLNLKVVDDNLTGDLYSISVLKDENDELLQMINDGLANIRESGEYDEIINSYID